MKKHTATGLLIILCFAASTFIVLESAGYYQNLYILVGLSGAMGLFVAILSEAFQLTLVIVLPTEKTVQRYSLMAIIALIFMMTIFAAGMNVGKPLIEKWSKSNSQGMLLDVLFEERKVLNGRVALLNSQNQKLNTVLSIQAERDSFKEIKDHLKKENPIGSILIQIELAALWLLRILIQLGNLFCARMIALNWKKKSVPSDTPAQTVAKKKAKVVRQWKAKNTRAEKGFIGILELDVGYFLAVSPDKEKKCKTFDKALGFFTGSPYEGKISSNPTS